MASLAVPLAFEGSLRWIGYGTPGDFLVPTEIDGRPFLVENPFFCRIFQVAGLERNPVSFRLDRPKKPGSLRIFLLGESAAEGFPCEVAGPARMLESMLSRRHPDREIEVVTAAAAAINSHALRIMARDIVEDAEPDLLIVYAGNNEVVGAYGPGTVFAPFFEWDLFVELSIAVRSLRSAQFLEELMNAVRQTRGEPPPRWKGMALFAHREVAADDPRLGTVYRRFGENVEAVVQDAVERGVPVVLSTMPVNLGGFPPFRSTSGEDGAEAFYRQGLTLTGQGRETEARTAFQSACNEDRLRFRADVGIQSALRAVAARRSVELVDAAALFAERECADTDLFVDHVHLSARGSWTLACDLLSPVERRLGLDRAASCDTGIGSCEEDLGVTSWDRALSQATVLTLMLEPPFTGRIGNDGPVEAARGRLRRIEEEMLSADTDERRIRGAEARRPDEASHPARLGHILLDRGDYRGAREAYERACRLLPHSPTLARSLELFRYPLPEPADLRLQRHPEPGDGILVDADTRTTFPYLEFSNPENETRVVFVKDWRRPRLDGRGVVLAGHLSSPRMNGVARLILTARHEDGGLAETRLDGEIGPARIVAGAVPWRFFSLVVGSSPGESPVEEIAVRALLPPRSVLRVGQLRLLPHVVDSGTAEGYVVPDSDKVIVLLCLSALIGIVLRRARRKRTGTR